MNKIERKIYNNHQLKNDDDSTVIFACAASSKRYSRNMQLEYPKTLVISTEILSMITDYTQKIADTDGDNNLMREFNQKLDDAKIRLGVDFTFYCHGLPTSTYFYVDGILNPNYPQIGTGVAMIGLEKGSAIEHNADECKKFAQDIYELCDRWVPRKPSPGDDPDEDYNPSCDDLLDFDNMALRNKYGSILKNYLYTSQTMEYWHS